MTDTIRGGVDAGRMPTRLMRAPLVFLATLAVVAVAASPAAATFGAPFDLSKAGRSAVLPQVALDANGDAVFACERFDGTNHLRIQARARSATGVLGPVQTLSDAGQDAEHPQVAVDADGDAVFTWHRFDGTNWRIQARARSAAGVLGPLQTLSDAGQNAPLPEVAVDPAGDATSVWSRSDGALNRIQTAIGP